MEVVFGESEPLGSDRFEQLYRRHYADILRYAARRVDRETATEIAGDTFLVAWRRVEDIPTDDARAWLYGVARRVLSNELRSSERRERLAARVRSSARYDQRPSAELADAVADREQVRALLAQLRPADREALELIEWDGLSPAEAARVVGCTVATFRVRLLRARRRLVVLYEHDQSAEGDLLGRRSTHQAMAAPITMEGSEQ